MEVGDCFADPGLEGFERVTDQDCAGPHDIQVFAEVFGSTRSTSTTVPGLSATSQCEERLIDIMADETSPFFDESVIIPEDVTMGGIYEEGESFGSSVFCIIESPSGGLVGSIVPE